MPPSNATKKPVAANPRGNTFKKVVDLYKQGKSVPQIAEAISRSRMVVYHHIRRAIERNVLKPRPNSGTDVLEVVARIKTGATQSEVAREMAVTRQNIHLIVKSAVKKGLLPREHEKEKVEGDGESAAD